MHATSSVTSGAPSRPHARLKGSLRTRRLTRIMQALDIPHDLARALPAHTLQSWGIEAIKDDSVMLLASAQRWRVMGVTGTHERATIFAAMRQMHRINGAIWALWFWFEHDVLCVATFHDDHILHAELHIQQPRIFDLERFAALSPPAPGDDLTWRRQICEALDQSRLTRRFYDDFVHARKRLAHAVKNAPGNQKDREALALTVLLRVIVLYFLQGRGALDGDARFLRHRLDAARASGASFWETVLRPLFFGALSRPIHERSTSARALGAIPFLNGGLFEPSTFERDHPAITWADEVWHEVFDAFFERYSFVLRDPTPQVHAAHIDPEMLGRVFEGLMCQDHRSQTGAFYTPAPLVARMVAQSLSGYLARKLSVPTEDLHTLVTSGSLHASIAQNPAHLQALARSLTELKILDPAVGTGAFLIEALGALRRCWKGVRTAGYMGGVNPHTYGGVRALIHTHLHGVDVNTTAVRLCELRMWLALLSMWPNDLAGAIATMEPLPNLGHRLAVGDSLIGPHEHVMLDVRGKRRSGAWRGWRPEDLVSAEVKRGCEELAHLQSRYLESHGPAKIKAQQELERVEREQVVSLLDTQRTRHAHDIRVLEQLAQTPDLFGDQQDLPKQAHTQLLMLYRERDALTRRIDLARRGDRALTFCYEARFGEVMARGGFDLILTNPPWVRATAQERQIKGLHGVRYQSAAGGLWRGAAQHGVRATFGTQPDLSALFIERSLELLRPAGRLCALVPAKLFRSLHGAAVRGVMAEHHIVALEDLSEATGECFDAVTYPAVIEIEKRASRPVRPSRRGAPSCPQPRTRITCWRGASAHRASLPLASICLHGKDMREPWVISAGAIAKLHALVHQPHEGISVLGHIEALRPKRGIMTGHNASFCMTSARALELCDGDENAMRRWTRSYVRGRDVRAWQIKGDLGAQRVLWPYDGHQPCDLDAMPEPMQAHFLAHESALRSRSDCRARTTEFWRLFRVQRGVEGPKVIWRDLSLWAEAACDEGGHVPMNTAYYIPCDDVVRAWLLTAWMNSWVTRVALHVLAERAHHGYRRHFGWTVASMKIPMRWALFIAGGDDPELAADCMFWRGEPDGPGLCEAALCTLMGIPRELMLDACGELVRHAKKSA